MARNAVDERARALRECRYLLHDRKAKCCAAFHDVFASEGIRCQVSARQSKPKRVCGTLGSVRQRKSACPSKSCSVNAHSTEPSLSSWPVTIRNETIRTKGTRYSSPPQLRLQLAGTSLPRTPCGLLRLLPSRLSILTRRLSLTLDNAAAGTSTCNSAGWHSSLNGKELFAEAPC